VVVFENGSSLYVCPPSGSTAAELSTPYATGLGTIARGGLVFDGASPPSFYFIGSAGLSAARARRRCSSPASRRRGASASTRRTSTMWRGCPSCARPQFSGCCRSTCGRGHCCMQ
jgi:hypothetical protein